MAKDFTKFKIKGTETWLPKNRLVLACLKQFFQDVEVKDYPYLKNTWPDEIQGGAGIIIALEDVPNTRYYFMDNILQAPDGRKYVVCNQWGAGNFERFIHLAASMGYPIENNQSELKARSKEIDEPSTSEETQINQIENPFQQYHSKNNADLNLVINIYGRMHQLFECIKDAEEEIDDIENHYDKVFDWTFKIDDDNLMVIELDGEKIFEGTISELALFGRDTYSGYDLDPYQSEYVDPKIKKIVQFAQFQEIDTDEIWVSKKNYLIVVPQGRSNEDRGFELAQDFDNRYSMINYGKYHLEAKVKLKSFSLSDLFFQMDPSMEDLIIEPSDGPYYVFSKIFHYEEGELEFEIIDNRVMDTDFANGWIYDC